MVKLLIGKKGGGKTKEMVDIANDMIQSCKGSLIFINKDQRLMCDLNHDIRVVGMDEFPHVTNSDEYIGFIYGILSSDHDIETFFIDSVLKHAHITEKDIPEFVERIKDISETYKIDFIVSLSLEKSELVGVKLEDFEVVEVFN